MRLFRDSYNRTNLTIGSLRTRAEIALAAVDEPWDGPSVSIWLRLGQSWVRIQIAWGRPR